MAVSMVKHFWALAGLLTLLIGSGGCARGLELAEVEILVGASLPANATDTFFVIVRGVDPAAYVRFCIPPATLDDFLQHELGLFHQPLRESYNPFLGGTEHEIPWWLPHEARSYAGGDSHTADKGYQILVDKTIPDLWTIYLLVTKQS